MLRPRIWSKIDNVAIYPARSKPTHTKPFDHHSLWGYLCSNLSALSVTQVRVPLDSFTGKKLPRLPRYSSYNRRKALTASAEVYRVNHPIHDIRSTTW